MQGLGGRSCINALITIGGSEGHIMIQSAQGRQVNRVESISDILDIAFQFLQNPFIH